MGFDMETKVQKTEVLQTVVSKEVALAAKQEADSEFMTTSAWLRKVVVRAIQEHDKGPEVA